MARDLWAYERARLLRLRASAAPRFHREIDDRLRRMGAPVETAVASNPVETTMRRGRGKVGGDAGPRA